MSDTGAVDNSDMRPFTSWRSALDWWFRPLIVARTWVAFGYLGVGALWAVVMFVATLIAVSVTFALLFAVVGVLLIAPTFALVDSMVGVERRRTAWIGVPVARRSWKPRNDGESRWARLVTSRLTDAERWRQVGFVVAFGVVAPILFVAALAPWIVLLGLFFANAFDLSSVDVFAVVAGLALAGVAPRMTVAVADVARSFVAWFTGPDATAELQGRVDELAGQRTLILEAVAAERRRIERNLHDGVQQQLVALGIDIGRARGRIVDEPEAADQLLDEALVKVRGAIGELRVIGRGLHPAVLDDRGLDAALSSIVADAPIPVVVSVVLHDELPDDVAATAYYVVNEAVANILKHAAARSGSVRVTEAADDGRGRAIRIMVSDDGRGGADPTRGSGLAGIRARVEGADGELQLESPSGGPTTLVATMYVGAVDPAASPSNRSPRSPSPLPPPVAR